MSQVLLYWDNYVYGMKGVPFLALTDISVLCHVFTQQLMPCICTAGGIRVQTDGLLGGEQCSCHEQPTDPGNVQECVGQAVSESSQPATAAYRDFATSTRCVCHFLFGHFAFVILLFFVCIEELPVVFEDVRFMSS